MHVKIEATQELTAVVGEGPNARPAAKIRIAEGRAKIWLAGHDPVELSRTDIEPLAVLFTSALEAMAGVFDPAEDEDPTPLATPLPATTAAATAPTVIR